MVAKKFQTSVQTGIISITENRIATVCSHWLIGPCSMWWAPVQT